MLTRRELLADSVSLATDATFSDPVARWLSVEAAGLTSGDSGLLCRRCP